MVNRGNGIGRTFAAGFLMMLYKAAFYVISCRSADF